MRTRAAAIVLAIALLEAACGPRRPVAGPIAPADAGSRTCLGTSPALTWDLATSDREVLDRWCASVGTPVVISMTAPDANIQRLIVLSWNVHVGGGRLKELVELIRERATQASSTDAGIVVLVQEAFRGGLDVSESIPKGLHVPDTIVPNRPVPDIVQVAKLLNLSLAYVPSMRNGPMTSLYEREDRGSAVLSSEPLSDVKAIELPFGRQRRVAVMATVTPRGTSSSSLVVVAGHFDVGLGRIRQARSLVQRIAALTAPGARVLIGMDTNATFGNRDSTVRTVSDAFPVEPCETGRTSGWFARLDFIFSNLPRSVVDSCETLEDFYGSDHRPLLLTIRY